MPRPVAAKETDRQIETWEITIPGTIYVAKFDRREDRWKKIRVGGRVGSRLLHISRDDRRWNQEQMPEENRHLDPFTNGVLRLVSSDTPDNDLDIRYHYTDDELIEMFDIREESLFHEGIEDIKSELVLRRLLAVGEKHGTVAQTEAIRALLEQRHPVAKSQKTIREMIESGTEAGLTHF